MFVAAVGKHNNCSLSEFLLFFEVPTVLVNNLECLPFLLPFDMFAFLSFLLPVSSRSAKITQENVVFLLEWFDAYDVAAMKDECVS